MRGLELTWKTLGQTPNEAALPVLLKGLGSRDLAVQEGSLRALLQRHGPAAETAVLNHWPALSERLRTVVAQRTGWLLPALRRALQGADPALFAVACDAATPLHEYELIPLLASAAITKSGALAQRAATTALELSQLLHNEVHAPRDYSIRRDPQLQRAHALPALERAVESHAHHGRAELVEAYLLLAEREDASLKRILQSPNDAAFAPIHDCLLRGSRQGIVRLLLTYLDDPHAPHAALQTIGARSDTPFLRALFRKIGGSPTPVVRANLKRIETIGWFKRTLDVIRALGEQEQPGLVQFAALSGINRRQAFEIIAFVLKYEGPLARRAAAEALAAFDGAEASELTVHALRDSDPQVRAAVLPQLRPRGIAGAIGWLLKHLESPFEAERAAASSSLQDFNFARYAQSFDTLSAEARASSGSLVRQVDPKASELLRAELLSTSRMRRLRGLEMAAAMQMVEALDEPIVGMLDCDDRYFRLDVLRLLAGSDTPRIRAALRRAMLDHHPLVQAAAEKGLADLTRGKTERLTAPLADTVSLTASSPRGGLRLSTTH